MGNCRKMEIERRVRQGGLYIPRTLIRRFLHCWQPRRDIRCEAREGIRSLGDEVSYQVPCSLWLSQQGGVVRGLNCLKPQSWSQCSVIQWACKLPVQRAGTGSGYVFSYSSYTHEAGNNTRLWAQPPATEGFQVPHCPSAVLEKGDVGVGGNAKACDSGDQPNFVFWDER